MPLDNPHAANVLFALEVSPTGLESVMTLETDLHLNVRHPRYDVETVGTLLMDARKYLETNADQITNIRIISICHDHEEQIMPRWDFSRSSTGLLNPT
jgi:hypothetical protein